MRPDQPPGNLIMELPVGIVIDGVVLASDAVVILARPTAGHGSTSCISGPNQLRGRDARATKPSATPARRDGLSDWWGGSWRRPTWHRAQPGTGARSWRSAEAPPPARR